MDCIFDIHEAKINLSVLVAKAEAGESVLIARAGHPVVRLVPVSAVACNRSDRRPGFMKHKIWIGPDFENPLPAEIFGPSRSAED
jgi:prevent-host-death family protein